MFLSACRFQLYCFPVAFWVKRDPIWNEHLGQRQYIPRKAGSPVHGVKGPTVRCSVASSWEAGVHAPDGTKFI